MVVTPNPAFFLRVKDVADMTLFCVIKKNSRVYSNGVGAEFLGELQRLVFTINLPNFFRSVFLKGKCNEILFYQF